MHKACVFALRFRPLQPSDGQDCSLLNWIGLMHMCEYWVCALGLSSQAMDNLFIGKLEWSESDAPEEVMRWV